MTPVTIFWDGDGWYFVEQGQTGRSGVYASLHAACAAAIDGRFEIVAVNGTRGQVPPLNPGEPAQPDDV